MIFENAPLPAEFSVSRDQMNAVAPHDQLRAQDQHRHIKRGVHAEQRLHDGVADVADVAEAEQKAQKSAVCVLRVQKPHHNPAQKHAAENQRERNARQHEDLPVGHQPLFSHHGAERQHGICEHHDQARDGAVCRVVEPAALAADKARRHREKQHEHLFNQCRNVHKYLISDPRRTRGFADAAGSRYVLGQPKQRGQGL